MFPVNSAKSSSFKVVRADEFDIQYLDQSGATGDYISDNFQIGGATIKALEMGLAYNATIGTGLIGIGYTRNEASDSSHNGVPFTYPSILDSMVSQGLIARKAYSLYLNDLEASTGSIIFGGLDADKYHGDLLQIPVTGTKLRNGTSIYAELGVALTSFGITGQQGNIVNLTTASFADVVILDSGTTITYLPSNLVAQLYRKVGAVDDTSPSGSGMVYIDCAIRQNSPALTFNYGFGGASGLTISVPIDEVIFDLKDLMSDPDFVIPTLPFTHPCGFGIWSGGPLGPFILGDTFLRSAYVVYDLDNNEIAIAQTNFNSTSSSIVEFQASETSIPRVSGLASSVDVTATATAGLPGIGGGRSVSGTLVPSGDTLISATATGVATTDAGGTTAVTGTTSVEKITATISSTPTASTSQNKSSAGVAAVPAVDGTALMILGFAGVLAVVGGGWFVS